MKKIHERFTAFIYLTSAIVLALMALMIIGWSVVEVVVHIFMENQFEEKFISIMLRSVGAIVISVAILDVAQYMFEEEILEKKKSRSMDETVATVTKIMVIVAIAVSIEGLVYIFKAGAEDLRLLVYPASLIVASGFLIIGLGVFQKLIASAVKDS